MMALGSAAAEAADCTRPKGLKGSPVPKGLRVPSDLKARREMMGRKGRLQVGSDADIAVFDPDTVIDTVSVSVKAWRSAIS